MVLNIINKTLNDEELEYINKLKNKGDITNIDFTSSNKKIPVKNLSPKSNERDILIDANSSSSIIIWGKFSYQEMKNKCIRSLISRRDVIYASFDDEDYKYYLDLKSELGDLYSSLINKFLVRDAKLDTEIEIEQIDFASEKNGNSFINGIKEVVTYRHMLFSMAFSTFKKETLSTTLGVGWHFVRDVIFFVTYVLFMLFVRGNSPIDRLPAVVYLIVGLVAWYFMFDVINGGVACIRQAANIIKKVKFPIVIIPFYNTLSILYRRVVTYVIVSIVLAIYVLKNSSVLFNPIMFIYYFVAMVIFIAGFNLVFSGIVAISKDFYQLYKAIARIQLYLNPIFWNVSYIETKIEQLNFVGSNIIGYIFDIYVNINPAIYLLSGFRESFGGIKYNGIYATITFWVVVLILYVIGFNLQSKLRRIYADVL